MPYSAPLPRQSSRRFWARYPFRRLLAPLLEEDNGQEDPALPPLRGEDKSIAVVDAVGLDLVDVLQQVASGPQPIGVAMP